MDENEGKGTTDSNIPLPCTSSSDIEKGVDEMPQTESAFMDLYEHKSKTSELSEEQMREELLDYQKHKGTTDSVSNISLPCTSSSDIEKGVDEMPQTESPFMDLYKHKSKTSELSQEQRREELLEYQKEQRHDVVDTLRGMSDLYENLSESDDYVDPASVTNRYLSRKENLKYSLMLTEEMKELPSDYPQNWLAKFCPEGSRNLLVAVKTITKCLTRSGKLLFTFMSNLPGGGTANSTSPYSRSTVLDCIYDKKNRIFFILDVLAWNGVPFYSYEAECRFYCLKSRFEELSPLQGVRKWQYKFHLLEYVECNPYLIQVKMNHLLKVENRDFLYDGVVFYHKESEYVFGQTPLALWLKSHRIPEILGIDILPNYKQNVYEKYTLQEFLQHQAAKQDQ